MCLSQKSDATSSSSHAKTHININSNQTGMYSQPKLSMELLATAKWASQKEIWPQKSKTEHSHIGQLQVTQLVTDKLIYPSMVLAN